MTESATPPEFSRPIRADSVSARELVETIEASEAERKALAERFELEAIGRLVAKVRLRRVRGGTMVRVSGELEASVVQTCVMTLDPVPAEVQERFDALFAPPELIVEPDEDDESVFFDPASMDEETDPEPIVNGRIDIGELAAQHLSLALDPYPRSPNAAFDPIQEHPMPEEGVDAVDEEEKEARPSPFAALDKLRRGE